MEGMVTETPRRAAFFDLDKTLIPGSSLFLLARGLYDRDLLRVRDLLRSGWAQLTFRLAGERTVNLELSRAAMLEFVRGRSRRELIEWGREIAEERILPRVYEDVVRVIEGHRERGDLTFLLTAAPLELAETVAAELEMSGAMGTIAEVDADGFYTGRLIGEIMHGPQKAKAAAETATRHGVALVESHAYSDSINDLPLLESVGFPHAVNPERELRRIALVRGWPIQELRTRRKAVLVGIPAGLGGAALLGAGVAIGMWIERRRAPAEGPVARSAHRLRI